MQDLLQPFMSMHPALAAVWAGLIGHIVLTHLLPRWVDRAQRHHHAATKKCKARDGQVRAKASEPCDCEGAGNE